LHTSIAFAQLEECPSDGISYLPHPDCTRYIICVNGEATDAECPRPLYYNPRTEHCEFPENVPECVGGTRPPVFNGTTTELTSTTSETHPPTEEPTLEPSTTETPPPNTLTECGQTIQTDSGYIQYKLNQNYSAGELCAFIIRLDRYTGCDFTLEETGVFNSSSDTITVFRISEQEQALPLVKLDRHSPIAYFLYSTFAVVFKTTSNAGTGFRLRFESRNTLSTKIPGTMLVYNNQTSTPLRFPLNPNGGSEWDAIIITSGAKLITNPESTLQLMVYDFFVNPDCNSWFNVHSFDGTTAKFEGRVCGLNKKALAFNTKGLFIVLFYKSSISTEDYLGSIEWFETTTNITSQN
ncbi:putative chitinase 3, partial [Orchesella cincta]